MTWMEIGNAWLAVGVLLAEAVRVATMKADPNSDSAGRYAIVTTLWPFLVAHMTIHALLTGKLPGK